MKKLRPTTTKESPALCASRQRRDFTVAPQRMSLSIFAASNEVEKMDIMTMPSMPGLLVV